MDTRKVLPLSEAKRALFTPSRGKGDNDIMIKKVEWINDDGEVSNPKYQEFVIFDNTKGYLFRGKNHSRKMYADIRLSEIITDRFDFMRVHLLAENIYKNTNCLSYRISARKIRMADMEDIANIVDLSPKKAREFVNRMKKLHIIAERVDTVGAMTSTKFVVNPLFFNSNKYIQPDLYFLFQESLDRFLPAWVISKFHEVGNIKKE